MLFSVLSCSTMLCFLAKKRRFLQNHALLPSVSRPVLCCNSRFLLIFKAVSHPVWYKATQTATQYRFPPIIARQFRFPSHFNLFPAPSYAAMLLIQPCKAVCEAISHFIPSYSHPYPARKAEESIEQQRTYLFLFPSAFFVYMSIQPFSFRYPQWDVEEMRKKRKKRPK